MRAIDVVRQTSDDGYILAGQTNEGDTPVALVIKTDSLGNQIWDRTFGTYGNSAQDIQQISDGGYIIAGYGFGPWIAKVGSN